jgi:transcriptional regulator with XRE-family HTH domain
MGDEEAVADFPDKAQRFAFCNSVYERAHNAHFALSSASLQGKSIRSDTLMGRDFLVVPAVLVQGQVLHNNLGATFLPPDEITEDWAGEWNGIPVVIHEHPTYRGVSVSARTPEIINARGVGFVYRAHTARNGTAQLKAEVWLDLERAEQVSELNIVVQRLRAGESVELSTGFMSAIEEVGGTYDGESYERILHPRGADHLAIFIDKQGACSLKDGCGLGVQQLQKKEEANVDLSTSAAENERGLVLQVVGRLVGLLGKSPTPCSQTATSSSTATTQATGPEFRLLLRRLKALGMTNAEIGEAVGRNASAISQAERGEIVNPSPETLERLKALAQTRIPARNQDGGERSDEERRLLLATALESHYGGEGKIVWIDAVFSEKQQVVFGVVMDDLTGRSEKLYSTTFAMADDGEITLDEPTAVARRVVYEPTGNTDKEEISMTTEQQAAADKEAADKAAADKKAEEAVANAAAAADKEAADKEAADKEAADKEAADKEAADAAAAANITPCTHGEQIAALQAEIAQLKTLTAPVVAEKERERQALVDELAANSSVPYDKAELEAKPVEELRKLQAMSRGESYVGRGGPHVATNVDTPQFAEPVPYFEQKKKEGEE